MRRFLSIASGIGAVAIATGCSLFVDLDALTGGATGASDAADDFSSCSGSACDGSTKLDATSPGDGAVTTEGGGPCELAGTAGPAMVAAAGFCIDSTEVTIAQYGEFLKDGFSGSLPSTCEGKTKFDPDTTGVNDGDCTPGNIDPSSHASYPITCVDWCDAWAYCNWAGKTICAAVDGGSLPYDNANTTDNEWYVACATPAMNTYPTGMTYDGGCNLSSSSSIAVGTDTACVGGYPDLFDMAGNVEEWIDACNTDGQNDDGGAWNDVCHEAGDAFNYSNTGPARCDNKDADHRGAMWADVGFRCCAPIP